MEEDYQEDAQEEDEGSEERRVRNEIEHNARVAWNVCVVLFTPRTNVSRARSPLCQTRLIVVSCQ